jgi:PAS domain S-box-containing protein
MLKILVVEDERIVALDIQRSLERLGYAVPAVVSSGEAAIEESERIRPDLVVMDIRLEGSVDGVAAAEQIRARYGIPVVYLTAHADEETLQRAKVTQPYGYLIKPFREEELRTSIEIATYTHQMQQKLRDSERRAATLLKSIGDGVIATDVDGLVTFMNPVAEALTGWTLDEAIGRDVAGVFRILNAKTQAPVENLVAAALQAGESGSLADHTVLVTRDGGSIPIDHSAAAIQDGRGDTTGAVFVFRDITGRKRTEEALQAHARQQEALFQLSADLTTTLDGAEICQRVVRGLHQKLGYDYLGLFLVDEATGERVLRASIGWPDAPAQWRLATGQGLSERPLLDGQLHYTPDVRQDPRYIRGIDGRSEVDVPLRVDEKVRGVLVVESTEVDAFDQKDFAVLTAAANQAATALERAREHQAARAAEVRYQSLFDRVPAELYRTTPAGRFLDANPALVEMLGYPDRESLLATNAKELYVNVKDRQRWQAVLERDGLVRDYETTIRRFDGSIIWARDDSRAVRDEDEQVLYYEGSLEDITERKRAEDALAESELKYRTLFEASTDGIFLETPEGGILDCNSSACSMLGYSKEELIELNVADLLPEDAVMTLRGADAQEARLTAADLIAANGTASLPEAVYERFAGSGLFFETANKRKDGQSIPVEVSARLVSVGGVQRAITFVRDITDRKRAETALRESEAKYRSLVEQSLQGIMIVQGPPVRIVFANPTSGQMLGLTPKEMTSLRASEVEGLIPSDDRKALLQRFNELLAGGPSSQRQIRLTHKEGATRWLEVSSRRIEYEGKPALQVAMVDITERKQAEEVLRRRAEELEALQATVLDITVAHDLPTLLLTIVERAARLLDAPMGGLYLCEPDQGQVRCVVSHNTPQDYRGTVLRYGEGAAGTAARTGESLIIDDYSTWDGRASVFEADQPFSAVLAVPMIWQGEVIGVIDTVRYAGDRSFTPDDLELFALLANHAAIAVENTRLYEQAHKELAERKRLEQQSEERRSYLESLLACAPDAIITLDTQHRVLEWNPGAEQLFGYPSAEAVGQDLDRMIAAPDARMFEQAVGFTRQALSGEPVPPTETIRYRKDGTLVDVILAGSPIFVEGQLIGTVAVYTDITQRKQTEEALRESEELYRTLVSASPDAVTATDLEGCITFVSPRTLELHGFDSEEELLGESALELIAPEDHARAQRNMEKTLQGAVLRNVEYTLRKKDGTCFAGGLDAALITDAQRRPKGFIATTRDITERKQAEEELRRLKEFNESIVQNVAEGIVVQDTELNFTFVNPAAAALLGYTPTELLGQHWTWLVPPDQTPIIQAADERRTRGEADRYEVELLRKDGTRVPVLISGSPRFDADTGLVAGMLAVFTDLSARREAEEKLARHAQEMAALYETLLEINAQPDLSTLLQAIVRRAARLLGAPMGGLYLVRPEDETLELVISHNLPGDYAGTRLRVGEGLSGRVAQSGKPIMVPNYREWEGRAAIYADGSFRRVLGVPLRSGDEVIGVINITDDEQVKPFDAEDIRLVSLFADQAAIAVENARLLEAEARRRREAETLQAATQALTATLDLPRVFELILRELRQVVPYDSASVQQLKGDWLEIIGVHGFPNLEEIVGIRFHLRARDNPNREVVRTRAPLILEDAPAAYEEFKREPHAPAGIRSWLGVPLLFGDRLIGMIALDTREPGFYTEDHARLAMAFAAQAAIAVENARLFQAEREQRELADRLRETALLVNSSLDLQEVLELILDQLARVLPYDSGSVQIVEPNATRVLAARNLPAEELGRRYPFDQYGYNRRLAQAQEPLVIQDVSEDGFGWLPSEGLEHVRSNIGVPLRVRDRVIGLLTIDGRQAGAYGEVDARIAQVFAQQAAIAIENARLYQAQRSQRELAEALREAARVMGTSLELDEILRLILDQLKRVLVYDTASVIILREDSVPDLVVGVGYGDEHTTSREASHLLLDSPILRQMAADLQPVVSADVRELEGWIWVPGAEQVRSWLGIPLVAHGQMIGALMVDYSQPGFYGEAEMQTAQALAQHAAQAIENARLFQAERKQHELAEALRQATAAVSSTLDLDQVLDHILEQVSRVIPADAANVNLIEDGYAHIVRWRGYERFGQDVRSVALRVADTPSLRHMRQTGETLIIPDTAAYADWVDRPEVTWIRSYVGAPIRVRDEVIGFLNVDSATPSFFEAAHADQLRAFADQASLALGNARLFEETRRRAEQMATLNRIGLAITSDLDLEEVLNTLYEQIERIVDVGAFYVALYDEATGMIHFPLLTGMTGPGHIDPLHIDRNPGLTGYTIRSGKPLYVADTRNVPPGEAFTPIALIDSPARSYIGVPLIFRERTIGALSIQSYEPNAYTEADLELLTTIATQATVAIENARLHSETQKRLQEQIALREAGAAISSALDQETVLAQIAQQMGQAIDASSAYVSSYDPETMMSTVMAEYIGPHASAAEAVSDLGVAYPEDGNAGWLALMQAGHHDVSHLDSTDTLDSERAHMQQYGAKTILYIPLRIRERLIGYVELWESRRRRDFAPEEIALCRDIAQQAAIALENARLFEQAQQEIAERRRGEQVIRQRNRELALLNRVIAASVASNNLETILETVCRELALAFDLPQSAAALLNPEQTKATVIAEYLAEDRPSALGEIIPVEGNPSMHFLLEQKAPLVVEDAQNDPRLAPMHDTERRRGTMSLLILPLLVEGEVIGSLGLDAIEPRSFTDDEVELARRAADQVSSVLARIRLEETQRRLSTAVEQAADAVVITDTKGVILYVNPALERITGYSRAEIIGQTPPALKGSRLQDAFHQELWQAVAAGDVWQERLSGIRKDGTSYTLDLTVSPVRNQAGEIATYVGTMRDVTREVQLEEQFQQAQKMEALGRLAGGIAHDFNNLLTVIRLSIRLLDRQLRPEDPLWEHVRRLEETSERAVKLTKQLLSFSRREIIEPHVLDLNGVVRELNRMLQRIMGEDIDLETRLSEDLWLVKIDPTQIEQVIMNLIVNARDAMPSGGTMTIETANVVLDEVYTATHMDVRSGEYVYLSIRDTGIGMSEEVRAHLFEPFFTTKERGQGTGLGLPTVFGIVKQNEGHVQVDSEEGQGTTFRIYLPRASEAEASSVTKSPIRPISPVRGSETVLVVEDETAVLDLAVRVLTSCGYTVLAASNGDKALEISERHDGPIHLLLTDVILPQMNGKELADRLRRQRPGMRVLYMSGYTDDAITHHGILAPGTVLLSKPFTVEHLAAKMRAVLDRPG